ncbi:hypothetical protein [Neisseria iguanae]|nr:hypothetical protein [Neisseria iguanae]
MLDKHGFGSLFEEAAHGENPLKSGFKGIEGILGILEKVRLFNNYSQRKLNSAQYHIWHTQKTTGK